MYDSGVITYNDSTMVYSGTSSQNKRRAAHGVAIYLDGEVPSIWKKSGSVWEAASERILKIHLGCKSINIILIAIYGPINANGQKQLIVEADFFCSKLQQAVDKYQEVI